MPLTRRRFTQLALGSAAASTSSSFAAEVEATTDPIADLSTETIFRNRNGESGTTWFHPRACMLPGGTALMTLQSIAGSDYFGPVHDTLSADLGKSWSAPAPVAPLGRIPVADHEGLEAGVCDVVPEFHPPTDTSLALGHVVFYRGPHFSRKDQLPRYPVYSVRHADGTWGERKNLAWDDPRGAFIYTNNCGQRVVRPEDGDIIMSFTFGADSAARSVAGVRCSFDGSDLKIREVGPALENKVGRGLLEPSVTRFGDRYWITIRAEDNRGYVSTSKDGLNYHPQTAWAWDDNDEPLTMSTTQQHWLTHSDALYLVYTRQQKGNNDGVIRWRSPLFLARVDPDPDRPRLIRANERVVFPLVGDGVNDRDNVPLMGNFHVTTVSKTQSWITVGEWLPKGGAKGDTLLARVKWASENRLAL